MLLCMSKICPALLIFLWVVFNFCRQCSNAPVYVGSSGTQLARLLGVGHARQVRQVDVYESPLVEEAWRSKRREIEAREGPQSLIWVFHGTALTQAAHIMSEGFKVGGRDIGVANGSVHGVGVYTATGPGTPLMRYGHGTTVILAVAIEGSQTRAETPNCDSWTPLGDWIVFRHGAQLLPKYVLHVQ